jgi:hypothetical protein
MRDNIFRLVWQRVESWYPEQHEQQGNVEDIAIDSGRHLYVNMDWRTIVYRDSGEQQMVWHAPDWLVEAAKRERERVATLAGEAHRASLDADRIALEGDEYCD